MARLLFGSAGLLFFAASLVGGVLSNDDFAQAINLGGGLPKATAATDLAEASSELLEPEGAGYQYSFLGVARSAWWSWAADATGWVGIELTGASAAASVYEGDSLDTLKERQITSPWQQTRHSLFRAEAGHTYHLRLIGDGVTTATLTPVATEEALFSVYDLSGPLPVESSRWSLDPIPEAELPEGAWGPGADGYDYVRGEWDCPRDGIFLIELISEGEPAGHDVSGSVIGSGWSDTIKGYWVAVRGEAGGRYSLLTSHWHRILTTVRLEELVVTSLTTAEVAGDLPLTVVRPMAAFVDGTPPTDRSLWQDIEWVATESRPCSVRCDPGQAVYGITAEVRPGEWEPVPDQQPSFGQETIYFQPVAGVRYRIRGSGEQPEPPWRVVIDWSSIAPNDELDAATDLGTAEDAFVAGTTRLATASPMERALYPGEPVDRVVWGRWTAPSSGQRLMSVDMFQPRTRIFMRVGGILVPVERVPTTGFSHFTFQAEAGITYYVSFATPGHSSGSSIDEYNWTWGITRWPPPDPPADPRVSVRSLGGRREAAENLQLPIIPRGQSQRVEWEWTPPCSGLYAVRSGSEVTIWQRDITGAEVAVSTQPWLALTHKLFNAEAGVNYIFRNQPSTGDEFFIHIRPFANSPHPTPELAGDLGESLPAHGQGLVSLPGEQSWWKWTAPITGAVTLPRKLDHTVSVFDENVSPIAAPIGAPDIQYLEVLQGRRYLFALPEDLSHVGAVEIDLRRTEIARPPHDDFLAAVDLGSDRLVKWRGAGHGGITRWTPAHSSANSEKDALTLSSLEPGEPTHPAVELSVKGSLWWRWSAPRTEPVKLHGLAFAAVFTGDSLGSLSSVETIVQEDGITFTAIAGTTFHIAGLRGAELVPSIELWLVAETPEILNDAFADRVPALATETPDVFAFHSPWQPAVAATLEPEEPEPPVLDPGTDPLGSTWWRWRCPATGFYRFSDGSYWGPSLGRIFTGDSLGTLQENPRSKYTNVTERGDFAAIAGRDYIVAHYQGPDSSAEDLTLLSRTIDHPYAVWVGQFSFTQESDLLESANPAGDGISNALKFFCGLDPSRNAYAGDDRNFINLPHLITTASGAMAFHYRHDWSNTQLVPSSYWTPRTLLQSSVDVREWREVYPLNAQTSAEGFTEVELPAPEGGHPLLYRLQFYLTYDP